MKKIGKIFGMDIYTDEKVPWGNRYLINSKWVGKLVTKRKKSIHEKVITAENMMRGC